MDHSKLFRVLVIGGAMLGTGCVETPPPAEIDAASDPEDGGEIAREDAPPAAMDDAGGAGADSGLVECGFCPNEVCCEDDGAGGMRTRPGMMCCWSTSC
jgi:hypothetical protein